MLSLTTVKVSIFHPLLLNEVRVLCVQRLAYLMVPGVSVTRPASNDETLFRAINNNLELVYDLNAVKQALRDSQQSVRGSWCSYRIDIGVS